MARISTCQTIEEALGRARAHGEFRYSFDMLARANVTAADAEKYLDAYANAIEAIGASAGNVALPQRPGISVKLSALHPRYEAISRGRVLAELAPRLLDLARMARTHDLQFTIDAEEADRLELSLDVIAAVLGDPSLRDWEGSGLAVQAYQKRAPQVIDWIVGGRRRADGGSPYGWSRAPIGTPRSSVRRSVGSPTIRCSPARR